MNGFIAATNQDWIDKLSILIDQHETRIKMGAEARKTVVDSYSIIANEDLYQRYFNEVLKD